MGSELALVSMTNTFLHFPSSSSLSSGKFSLERLQLQLQPSLDWCNHQLLNPRRRRYTVYACSIKKTRGNRKIKSNVELCNEIRDFVEAVGLPEGHIPSMKELSQHGRSDLAYIVRRRGYKLLRELLTNSTNTEETESILAGQFLNEQADRVHDSTKGLHPPIEGSITGHCSNDMNINRISRTDFDSMAVESSASPSRQEKSFHKTEFENSLMFAEASTLEDYLSSSNASMDLRTEHRVVEMDLSSKLLTYNLGDKDDTLSGLVNDVSSTKLPSQDSDLNTVSKPFDPSADLLLERETPYFVNGSLENSENRDFFLSIESSAMENISNSSLNAEPAVIPGDHNYLPVNISLEAKVANFIQNGDLDTIDDDFGLLLSESDTGESKGSENATEMDFVVGAGYAQTEIDGSMLTSSQLLSSRAVNPSSRADLEELSGQFDRNFHIKTSSKEKQGEITHLKSMLHQKEFELSQLKEQIEKEKLALSLLQTKAETEISKGQQLISEKDEELFAAEESLSGLEEVQVQYYGDGDIVEVAGSFNGWQRRFNMDLQPPSNIMDPIGLRKFRYWSTVLWLYPGVYEIKFIVDGHWRIDPQREIASRGAICNNILRVEM